MRIIDTAEVSKRSAYSVERIAYRGLDCAFKTRLPIYLRILIVVLCAWNFSGCAPQDESRQVQKYVGQSQEYYQRAIAGYQDLIKKGKDLDALYFELGELYYNHGDFVRAKDVFQKTSAPLAIKFLAMSYYRMGDFTDALESFSRQESIDDEYLYYYGLTCEKLNLFDKSLELYKKINGSRFSQEARARLETIEKEAGLAVIKDVDPTIYQILSAAPPQESYPQAGALVLYCDEKIKVNPDYTQVSQLHYLIKILNQRGKENFAETQIEYDSTYEKIELEYARTIKPDGTIAEVGSRHIRDVSKYLNFPLYSNARVFIISFPEIAQGASIEYKLTVYRSQLINKKDFVLNYPVQADEPIIAANFTLSLPSQLYKIENDANPGAGSPLKSRPVYIKTLNEEYNKFGASLKPSVEEKDGLLNLKWTFKDIPQIIPEPNMPPEVKINPTILISTFSRWDEIYNWWWKLAKDKISVDSAIKEKVAQLTKGLTSFEAKARAIYNFCAQNIRYVAVEYGQAGHEPHYAGDVFKNKYGDCKDQAILLVTMLKEAGVSAHPVLIATREYYNLNEDFPSLLFNHCIAVVFLEDKEVFLDPTAQTCSFGDLPADDQARKVLVITEQEYKISSTPLYPAEHNLVRQHLKIKVNDDETIDALKDNFTYGIFDQAQRYWLLYTPPELVENMLKEKIQEVSIGSTLGQYTIKNLENLNTPLVLSYSFKGREYFTNAGNLRIMPQLTELDTALVAKGSRKYAIDFNVLDSRETIFDIEIPGFFAVKYMPGDVSEDSPWLKLFFEYKLKGNTIYFRQKVEVKSNAISAGDYPAFKDFFEKLARKIKQRIVLERLK